MRKSGQKTIKTIKYVLFSESGKWHDPKNKEIISKMKGRTCRFPELKPLKQIKINMRLFFGSKEVLVYH
jgi:hypothetical protein